MKKNFPKNVSGKSHSAENPKEGTLWGFLKSILLRTVKKLKGDSLETSKQNLTAPTLHLNFENVISELWNRYIRTFKCYIRTLETLHPNFNFGNVSSELKFLQTAQLIKLIKSVTSSVFVYSLRFLRKALTKNVGIIQAGSSYPSHQCPSHPENIFVIKSHLQSRADSSKQICILDFSKKKTLFHLKASKSWTIGLFSKKWTSAVE